MESRASFCSLRFSRFVLQFEKMWGRGKSYVSILEEMVLARAQYINAITRCSPKHTFIPFSGVRDLNLAPSMSKSGG